MGPAKSKFKAIVEDTLGNYSVSCSASTSTCFVPNPVLGAKYEVERDDSLALKGLSLVIVLDNFFIYLISLLLPRAFIPPCQKKISPVETMFNNFSVKDTHIQGAGGSPSHFLWSFFTDIRGLTSASQLEQLNKRYWYICQDFTEYKYTHQPNRFPDLMMCLPEIRYIAGNGSWASLLVLTCEGKEESSVFRMLMPGPSSAD